MFVHAPTLTSAIRDAFKAKPNHLVGYRATAGHLLCNLEYHHCFRISFLTQDQH